MSVLIAGCGDVGSRLARLLAAAGADVVALRRSPRVVADGVCTLAADLGDPASLRALPGGIDQVVYLPAPDARTPEAYRRVFLDGPRHLLDVLDADALRRFVFVSSSSIYGDHGGGWVDEATPPSPPGFNGAILLQAEQALAARGLPLTVLRLAGLYGPGRLHPVERLRSGQARVPRAAPVWANRIHVDDAAAALAHVLALDDPTPLYLGVDDTPLPLHVLYDDLARRLSLPPPPEGPGPSGVGSKRLSNARLRGSGFVPRWSDAREGYAALLSGA